MDRKSLEYKISTEEQASLAAEDNNIIKNRLTKSVINKKNDLDDIKENEDSENESSDWSDIVKEKTTGDDENENTNDEFKLPPINIKGGEDNRIAMLMQF